MYDIDPACAASIQTILLTCRTKVETQSSLSLGGSAPAASAPGLPKYGNHSLAGNQALLLLIITNLTPHLVSSH